MKSTGIVREIDKVGRVVIPKEIRNNLQINDNDPMEIFIDNDCITVTVKEEKLTEPQVSQIYDVINEYIDTKNVKIVEVK